MPTLIVTAPISSNFLATIKLAKFLMEKDTVFYATSAPAYQLSVLHGFDSFELHTRPFVNSDNGNGLFYSQRNIHREYLARSEEFKYILNNCQPDIVYIDTFAGTDLLFIKESLHKVKVVYLHPMLSLSLAKNYPRFNQDLTEANKWAKRTIGSNIQHIIRILLKLFAIKVLSLTKFIFGLGLTSLDYAKDKFICHNLTLDEEINISLISKKVPQIILAPSELEYSSAYINENQHYLGLCIEPIRAEPNNSDFNFDLLNELIPKYKHMIYISFGIFGKRTVDEVNIQEFASSIIEVADQLKDILFVISSTFRDECLFKLSGTENIKIYKYVPQIQLLKMASIFICHGGLGSIKEAIFTKTPLIICVLDSRFDQKGNASKVEFHGLGINLGKIEEIESSQVIEAINMIIYDLNYTYKMESFSEYLIKKYNTDFWKKELDTCLEKAYES